MYINSSIYFSSRLCRGVAFNEVRVYARARPTRATEKSIGSYDLRVKANKEPLSLL